MDDTSRLQAKSQFVSLLAKTNNQSARKLTRGAVPRPRRLPKTNKRGGVLNGVPSDLLGPSSILLLDCDLGSVLRGGGFRV